MKQYIVCRTIYFDRSLKGQEINSTIFAIQWLRPANPPLHERKWIVILVWRRCNSTYMYRVRVLVSNATFNNISRTCIDDFNRDFNRDLWFDLIHILFCTRYIYLFSLNRRYRYDMYVYQGRIQGGRGAAPSPPKIGKNMIFWRKIVIFHTKYPKHFRASLRSAQFF